MIILLGSKNPSKKRAVIKALEKLQIYDYEIITYDAKSMVNSKPIGYEIIRGAENRNNNLKEFAILNNIEYDYLCSIEGGFAIDENGIPFVVTYCVTEDSHAKKSTGKSLGIRISKTMFKFLKEGGSLNKVINDITNVKNNKQNLGITGYLSNGLYRREDVDSDAVVSSLIPFIYTKQREEVDSYILKLSKQNKFR